MEPDRPSSVPPSDSLCSLQPARTDSRPFQGGQFDEGLLDPSAPSQGTSTWPGMFQGPIPSSQPRMPRGNEVTTNINIPNIPYTNIYYGPLSLGTPSQQFQHGNPLHPLGTLECPYIEQPQTIHPFPATNIPLHGWQQSTSLLQNSLGPPQSHERIEPGHLGLSLCASTSSGPPPAAVTTNLRREPVDRSATNSPPSAVRGIELATPQPAKGETTVRVRRDSCVTLSFDMQSLSSGSATYDGLKIPRTRSVKSRGSVEGKKLLRLQIRVLGATTRSRYETLCDDCNKREGDKGTFPDFRAQSNIRVPQKDGKLFVAFFLACHSKHRGPKDSEYRLEVVLKGGAEKDIPIIKYELPYTFDVVSKLPPRARSQAEDVDAADAVAPPSKLPRTGRSCVSHAGNPVSQGAGPFRRDELSSGDSGDSGASTDNIPSGTSGPPTAPLGNHNLESSAEAPVPSSQYNQAVNTANDETAVGEGVVVEKVNPKQGPTVGGPEIWISGSNFPTDPRPLYVRFGVNPARVAFQIPGLLLSCSLPPADVPGKVKVFLSRSSDPRAPVLGTSICQFEYITDLNEMTPVMIRIQEDCTPEAAAALDILHKEMKNRNLKRNGKRPLRGGEACHDEIETAIIHALASLQDTQDSGRVLSKTNDYKQTLAHFAVHFGYTNLLSRLVEWNIDLTIADVNGFTALHFAYKKGDRACVDLLLEEGAPETVLDALGRAPSHLMPEGFASLSNYDSDTASDDQLELGQKLDAPSLSQSTDSWDGVSDSGEEMSMDKTGSSDLMHQSQFSSAASDSQITLPSPPLPVAPAYPPLSLAPSALDHTINDPPTPNIHPLSPPSPFRAPASSLSSLQRGEEPPVKRSSSMDILPEAVPADNPSITVIPHHLKPPPSVCDHRNERTTMNQYASPPPPPPPTLPPDFQKVSSPPARYGSPPSAPLSPSTLLAPQGPLKLPRVMGKLPANSQCAFPTAVPSSDIQQPGMLWFEQVLEHTLVTRESPESFACGGLEGAQEIYIPGTQKGDHAAAPQQLDVRTKHEPIDYGQTAAVPVPFTAAPVKKYSDNGTITLPATHPSMSNWSTGLPAQQGSASSLLGSQIRIQLSQLYVVLQGYYPAWCQENTFFSLTNGRTDAELCELAVIWQQIVVDFQAQRYEAAPVASNAMGQYSIMDHFEQDPDTDLATQQSFESFAFGGLTAAATLFSVPGIQNNEQEATPQQPDSRMNYAPMGHEQPIAAPAQQPSFPPTPAPVEADPDNATTILPPWISLVRPQPEDQVITVRRECYLILDIKFNELPALSGLRSVTGKSLVIPSTVSVRTEDYYAESDVVHLSVRVFGADTGKEYESVCNACGKREGKKKGNPSLVDFYAVSNVIKASDDGLARVKFKFSCYPKHQNPNESAYMLEVTLMENQHQGQMVHSQNVVATCRLPWHFNIGRRRPDTPPPSYRTEPLIPTQDELAASDMGAPWVAESPQRKRGRATADLDDEESTGGRCVRPRLEKGSDTPSTDGPGVPLANHSHPQPFTTATGPTVARESTTGGVPSSSDTPTTSMTSRVSQPGPSLHPVRKQQNSGRPVEPIITILRATNPRMGPVSGGIEIWLSVDDLPTTFTLYARFGTQVTATAVQSPNMLACVLPSANHAGRVKVTLSRSGYPGAPEYGTSIAAFEYKSDSSLLIPLLLRIEGKEQLDAIQAILRMLQGVHGPQDPANPQDAQIQSPLSGLSALREKSNSDDIVPTEKESNQALAHLSTLYGYILLLMYLVEWRIDLIIPDISGLIAPHHYSYLGQHQESIQVPMRVGALLSINIKLGRLPRDLLPQGSNLAGWLDRVIGIGAGSPPIEHPVGHVDMLVALFAALGAGEKRVYVSGHGGPDFGGIGSLTLEPGPSISTISIVDHMVRLLISMKPLEKRSPRLVPDPLHAAIVSTRGNKLQDAEAEYAANEYLRNGVSPDDIITLEALKTPTKAAQTQDATPFWVEEGTERFQRLLTRAQEVLNRHLFPEDNRAEFKDPEAILAKGHFDIGHGGCDNVYRRSQDVKGHWKTTGIKGLQTMKASYKSSNTLSKSLMTELQ